MTKVFGYSIADRKSIDKLVFGVTYLLKLGHIEYIGYSLIITHYDISTEVNAYPIPEGVIIVGEGFAEQADITINDIRAIKNIAKNLVTKFY